MALTIFTTIFTLLMIWIIIINGLPSTYYNKVASSNYDTVYDLFKIIHFDPVKFNINETIRQCTCLEYDTCVNLTAEQNRISRCQSLCLSTFSSSTSSHTMEKHFSSMKKKKAFAYIVHNCFKSDYTDFCAASSPEFIKKSNYSSNIDVTLKSVLLRNNVIIGNSSEFSYEEYQLHRCSAECLLKDVKKCFASKQCDIQLPKNHFRGCIYSRIPDSKTKFLPRPLSLPQKMLLEAEEKMKLKNKDIVEI